LKGLQLRGEGYVITLTLRTDWSQAWPQSAHLLREEVIAWQKTPWILALA
jgi:exopolyphosphatase/guanosine-5'-triphosphate,3'-diphosphate pyrophosphatase